MYFLVSHLSILYVFISTLLSQTRLFSIIFGLTFPLPCLFFLRLWTKLLFVSFRYSLIERSLSKHLFDGWFCSMLDYTQKPLKWLLSYDLLFSLFSFCMLTLKCISYLAAIKKYIDWFYHSVFNTFVCLESLTLWKTLLKCLFTFDVREKVSKVA